ncbi:MAG: GTPase HflX [Patescibacteria group bacterium]|nr:GTPase HflX [Patescibacteria group bacterium]
MSGNNFGFQKHDALERVLLVALVRPFHGKTEIFESLTELALLAESAQGVVVDKIIQERPRVDPATFIGKGKAHEVAGIVHSGNVNTVIFDEDLTPAQVYNLETIIKRKVIDRTGLILDIFAKHARTREAKTQVELAQLNYMLPSLTGRWSHFSRQEGGIGLRGPGETQLETDRRLVRKRIAKLREELNHIEKQRVNRYRGRKNTFKAALVGYTNAGKSTLMNALTKATVLVEDKLFATLDSTVRKMPVSPNQHILLSDTVGFIKKLPHHLIASFHSTLGEVREADLLIHVVDFSHPHYKEQLDAVNGVLQQLEVADKPVLLVFNKLDLVDDREKIDHARMEFPDTIFISAMRELGLLKLTDAIQQRATQDYQEFYVTIPLEEQRVQLPVIKRHFEIMETTYEDSTIHVRIRGNRKMIGKVKGIMGMVKVSDEER